MGLTPLQSRLVGSLAATILLILLYLFLFPPNFADAAEIEADPSLSILGRTLDEPLDYSPNDVALAARSLLDPTYEPEFMPFGRTIIGRAPAEVTPLTNNEAVPMNVEAGSTQRFVFILSDDSESVGEEKRLELRSEQNGNSSEILSPGTGAAVREMAPDKEGVQLTRKLARRQSSRTVYISANTCQQPQPIDPVKTTVDPPQLTLYVSISPDNDDPNSLANPDMQAEIPFKEGAVMYNITTDRDVYIGIHAPNVSSVFKGIYNFEVAASIDTYYFRYEDDAQQLIWVDSDSQGALLITHNLTIPPGVTEEAIMNNPPYVLFAHNKKDAAINGLKHSYCGLMKYAQMAATNNGRHDTMVRTSMTKRGQGSHPKQQFFFSGLNSSSEYIGILAKDGPSLLKRQTTGQSSGGITVFGATAFSTKSDHGNCALIVDLEFCDQVAYSVPFNPSFGNTTQLAKFYDSYAAAIYANFNKSLAQIACEAPPTQRYSLARNCNDCAEAYKDWLCTVTIPRCEDFSNNASYLQPRAVIHPFPNGETLDQITLQKLRPLTKALNNSRSTHIDEFIRPGPHKELLPCDFLCYKLVQSCPAALGFGCPVPGSVGFEGNYAKYNPTNGLTCNFPGSAHFPSAGSKAGVRGEWWRVFTVLLVILLAVAGRVLGL